jgi:hypothetical protein
MWVVSFTPRRLYSGERAPGTHCIGQCFWTAGPWPKKIIYRAAVSQRLRSTGIGGWVDPRAGLDYVEKRKFLTLPGLQLRPFGRPSCSQSLYRLSYPGSLYSIYLSVTESQHFQWKSPWYRGTQEAVAMGHICHSSTEMASLWSAVCIWPCLVSLYRGCCVWWC